MAASRLVPGPWEPQVCLPSTAKRKREREREREKEKERKSERERKSESESDRERAREKGDYIFQLVTANDRSKASGPSSSAT